MTVPNVRRVLGLSLPALATVWALLGVPALFRAAHSPCPTSMCQPFERPPAATIAHLNAIGVSLTGYAAAVTAIELLICLLLCGVALLLVWHRPDQPIAVLSAVLLAGIGAGLFTLPLASAGGIAAGADVVRQATVEACIPLLAGVFPDGRWRPRWYALVAPIAATTLAGFAVGDATLGPGFANSATRSVVELVIWALMAAVQVYRFWWVSDWIARQQAKWLVAMFLISVVIEVAAGAAFSTGRAGDIQLPALIASDLTLMLLGLGFGLGLFRLRLYDVQIVLRRTVIYTAALTGLVLSYLLLVSLADVTVARRAAPAIGATAVAVLACIGGLAVLRLRNRIRRRVLGRSDVLSTLLAGWTDNTDAVIGADAFASTIALGMGLTYVAVIRHNGTILSQYGQAADVIHAERVVDAAGQELGCLLLRPPTGSRRLDRHHRHSLNEVLPFVAVVLRARDHADRLVAAQWAMVGARDTERERLRRDLHDAVGPLLAGQLLALDTLRLINERQQSPAGLLTALETQTRSAMTEVRRIAHDLRPAAIEARGLTAALAQQCDWLTAAGLPVDVTVDVTGVTLPAAVETAVFRIVQESFANIVRHAHATHAGLTVAAADGRIDIVVTDNGAGYHAGNADGIGIDSMRTRARELGGSLEVGPDATSAGTVVHARIPL